MGTFDSRGQLDPATGTIITCVGQKGTGKSIMAGLIASTWPYDMVVIDVAGDDGPMPRRNVGTHDVVDITGAVDDLPRSWPEHLRSDTGRPLILRYVPDPGSPTELEDMDAVVGLAWAHSGHPRPVLMVVHEIGRVAPANRTPAHMRRVLNHNRHRLLPAIFCGPRPHTIDPLVMSQSDLVYVFELRNWRDRRRVADDIGWEPASLDEAVHDLGQHEYLRYDASVPKPEHDDDDDLRLVHYPALPPEVVDQVKRWVAGDQPRRP